jgi:glycosyltransferase involved in cell wall biosynthesis
MLKNKERSGPGVARNKGLDYSYNDYIFMLDADDYFL